MGQNLVGVCRIGNSLTALWALTITAIRYSWTADIDSVMSKFGYMKFIKQLRPFYLLQRKSWLSEISSKHIYIYIRLATDFIDWWVYHLTDLKWLCPKLLKYTCFRTILTVNWMEWQKYFNIFIFNCTLETLTVRSCSRSLSNSFSGIWSFFSALILKL